MIRALLLTLLVLPATVLGWDDRRLQTPLVVQGLIVPHPVFAIYPMPGAQLRVRWRDNRAGVIRYLGRELPTGTQELHAPRRPGLSILEVTHAASGEQARVHVFTLVPAGEIDSEGNLRGYRIGAYPGEPLRGLDIYLPPPGFVEVTRKNADTLVSPNFRIGQFVSKQAQGFPKFVVLRPELLLKLEAILARLNHDGHRTEGLVIMSGYRTPSYNRSIGNVKYSRHVWGGAADVYIDDRPRDGRMDDLNRDGKRNFDDARWLADRVEKMSREGVFGKALGGIGVYGANAAHGPFVHVDVRGSRARW